MPDFPDSGRALQDQVGNVFRQERARHISRYIFDELRRDVDDKFVRRILQAVFVADAVIHDCSDFGGRSFCAGFYQRATHDPHNGLSLCLGMVGTSKKRGIRISRLNASCAVKWIPRDVDGCGGRRRTAIKRESSALVRTISLLRKAGSRCVPLCGPRTLSPFVHKPLLALNVGERPAMFRKARSLRLLRQSSAHCVLFWRWGGTGHLQRLLGTPW